MKIDCSKILKHWREERGLNQSKFAELLNCDPKRISLLETGKQKLDIWQLMEMAQPLGILTEDLWLLFLTVEEYKDYEMYRHLKRLLRDEEHKEAKQVFDKLKTGELAKNTFLRQFIAYVEIKLDFEIQPEQAIGKIYDALHVTKPDFDESKIVEYHLNYNEICLIVALGSQYSKQKKSERAIDLNKAIIDSRENIKATEDDKAMLYPSLMFNICNLLGRVERYEESLEYCRMALKVCREYNNLRLVPQILYNMATGYQLIGEEEKIYKPYLVRAYHTAYGIGALRRAAKIKKDAEVHFGITSIGMYD